MGPVSSTQSPSHHPHPTLEESSIGGVGTRLEANVDQQPHSLILHKSELRGPKSSSTSFSLKRKSRSRTRKNNNNNSNSNSKAKSTKKLFQLRGVGSQRSTNESSESATGEFECHPEPSLTNSFQEPTYQTIEKALFVGDNSSESDHALPDPEQEDLDEIYAARHGDRQRPPL